MLADVSNDAQEERSSQPDGLPPRSSVQRHQGHSQLHVQGRSQRQPGDRVEIFLRFSVFTNHIDLNRNEIYQTIKNVIVLNFMLVLLH